MPVELTLSGGAVVRVYAVSGLIINAAIGQVTLPDVPMVTEHVGAEDGGHDEIHPAPKESAAYQQYEESLAVARREQNKRINEASLMAALRDVQVPADDDWYDAVTMEMVGLKRREGAVGRKLDYLQLDLLAASADYAAVFDAIEQLANGKAQQARALEDAFRGPDHGQRQATGRVGAATPA